MDNLPIVIGIVVVVVAVLAYFLFFRKKELPPPPVAKRPAEAPAPRLQASSKAPQRRRKTSIGESGSINSVRLARFGAAGEAARLRSDQ